MYKLYQFNSVDLPDSISMHELGPGRFSSRALNLPGGGLFDPDGAETVIPGLRQIRCDGRIGKTGTEAQFETALDNLMALDGVRAQLTRQKSSDSSYQWIYARCVGVWAPRSGKNHVDVSMMFELLQPSWSSSTQVSDVTLKTGPTSLTNSGNVNQRDIQFTIGADSTDITAISIANTTTGHTLEWAGTLTAGNSLVIDCGALSVLNNGSGDYASLTPPSDKDEWMMLEPGTNSFTVTITGGSASSTFVTRYYHPYA